ncbi:MAG TPA: DUF6789 family protein [Acidobacteriota bacterium]|nr:DUF6789 family protein [Acidobacteriota bacterium]
MKKLKKFVLAGLIATTVMTFFSYFVPQIAGQPAFDIGRQIGETIFTQENQVFFAITLGLLVHLLVGVFILPLIYSITFYKAIPGPGVIRGSAYSIVLFLLTHLLLIPVLASLKSGGFGIDSTVLLHGDIMIMVWSLAEHLIYGILLGLFTGRPK